MRGILIALALFSAPALAHDAPSGWAYPRDCCYGTTRTGDCHIIPRGRVMIKAAGFAVSLVAGDHPWVSGAGVITLMVPHGRERTSPDGEYHICLMQAEPHWRCFFAPPPGS